MALINFKEIIYGIEVGTTVEIHYLDGTIIEGFIIEIDGLPDNFTAKLCKSQVNNGENPNHIIILNKIEKIIVKPYGKESIVYQ